MLPPATSAPLATDAFTAAVVVPFPEFYVVGATRRVAFSDRLLLTCVQVSSMSFLA